jgi:hypothetical protein
VYTACPRIVLPLKKQACADSKRDSNMTKIHFSVAYMTEL